MTPKRLYFLLLFCLALVGSGIVASGFVANNLLTHKSAKLSKLKAEAKNQGELQIALSRNKRDLRKYSELNQIAKTIVPQEKDQAVTVLEISRLAAESGIPKLTSITFPASSLSIGASGSKVNNLSQVTPVKGLSGVYLLPITVTLDSSNLTTYTQFINFLQRLEQNRRTAQVGSVSITPDTADPSRISFSLTINKYVKL